MADFSPQRDALFIDIDGTLTDVIAPEPAYEGDKPWGHGLLRCMKDAAVEQLGMPADEAAKRIEFIYYNVKWWHWTDFLRALELDAHRFWEYAYKQESLYLGPVEEGLDAIFSRLLLAGYRMFITSNNPSSGILHKLRLAGLAEIYGSRYFMQYFSPCDLHYMKSDPEFWHRALAHSGLSAERVVPIGDNWHDDIQMPREAGIQRRIYLDRKAPAPEYGAPDVWIVSSWKCISGLLLDQTASLA